MNVGKCQARRSVSAALHRGLRRSKRNRPVWSGLLVSAAMQCLSPLFVPPSLFPRIRSCLACHFSFFLSPHQTYQAHQTRQKDARRQSVRLSFWVLKLQRAVPRDPEQLAVTRSGIQSIKMALQYFMHARDFAPAVSAWLWLGNTGDTGDTSKAQLCLVFPFVM